MGTIGGIPVKVPIHPSSTPTPQLTPAQIPLSTLPSSSLTDHNIRNITVSAQSQVVYTQPYSNTMSSGRGLQPQVIQGQGQIRPAVIQGNVRPVYS